MGTLLHYLQTLATDLVGPYGGPKVGSGFFIATANELDRLTDLNGNPLSNDQKDALKKKLEKGGFLAGVGHYYVDGMLCENEDFLTYLLRLKDGFSRYYFVHRYNQIDQTLEPFVKNYENIFLSRSILPGNYWKGMLITFLLLSVTTGRNPEGITGNSETAAQKPAESNWISINWKWGRPIFIFPRNVDPGKKMV
jgi:hypothetical protein